MGGRKSKSSDNSTPFPNNLFQNQNYNYNNHGHNQYNQPHMNDQNHFGNNRHGHAHHNHHNHWNHRMNNHHHHRHHHNHHHQNNQNHGHFNHNNFNQNDRMNSQHPSPHDNGYNEHMSFPPEDFPQDPFQHPDPNFMNHEGPRPVMNPNIDRMNNYRRMRRRPRRRVRRRRAFDPFVDGEFLAENNPEFFVNPNQPRYLTNKDVKFMKNTYWKPDDEQASSSSHSGHSKNSELNRSEPNNSHSEQSNLPEYQSPLEKITPPKLKKLNIKPFKKITIPDIKFEPEPTKLNRKTHVLSRYNKKKYPTTFYAKPVRPKNNFDELHFKVFNNRENPLNDAKFMLTSIRVPNEINNQVTIEVEQ